MDDTRRDHGLAVIRQIPSRVRSKLLVRVGRAGASHELMSHLLSLASRRRIVLCAYARGISRPRSRAGHRGPS